ncbi:MAG TPA: sulfur carrier protein ThiS [Bacteroidales bacterium]|nr:sulfur carrier protein ThiS [Bacteroidales bacterium]HQB56181.1 sulfur carrier protein ThiS [Bacteroidales bacterium]
MTITLNNRTETFQTSPMSIAQIIEEKNYRFRMLVVKLNGRIISGDDYPRTMVHNGDRLDIIHLVSGG